MLPVFRAGDKGVIKVGMLAKIRRIHIRDGLSLREIARQTGLSRNTIRIWLRQTEVTEPKYPAREVRGIVDPYAEQLNLWLQTDSHRSRRDRRTARVMYKAIKAQGYAGGYRYGLSLVLIDETQFLTLSADATARLMQLLYTHGQIGVPFAYVSNYSLCHKLLARP